MTLVTKEQYKKIMAIVKKYWNTLHITFSLNAKVFERKLCGERIL